MFERDDAPGMDRALLEGAWRYQLIAPLLDSKTPRHERDRYRAELLAEKVEHPWRGPVRLSARTVRRWCGKARKQGLVTLLPRARKDRGKLAKLPAEALQRALELRQENPQRTVVILMELLVAEHPEWEGRFSRSTLDRHLRAAGSRRQARSSPEGPFTAFEAAEPNHLWQGDILHGPVVRVGDKTVKSRLVCWIDDHSRYVCHLEAYADEKLASVEDALRKAILKHGLPRRLFVDNGLVYSGSAFTLACSELGVGKVHSTPRYPVSRGKQERFFRTLRQQLLDEVERVEPLELPQLNRVLVAWLDRYHHSVHSRTQQTPAERFAGHELRPALPERLEQAFWQWAVRDVSPTGELKFCGNRYRVDLSFAGRQKMVIRYDPADMSRVHLWQDGRRVATAAVEELLHRTRPGRPTTPRGRSEAARLYLERLQQAHKERLARELNLTRYREENEEEKP
jgi:transposase InsO family protein